MGKVGKSPSRCSGPPIVDGRVSSRNIPLIIRLRFPALSLLKIPSALSLLGFRVRGYSLPQFSDSNESGPMSSGSPGDRLFELKTWFGSHVLAQVIGSNSEPVWLTPGEPSGLCSGPIQPHYRSPADCPGIVEARGDFLH